MNWGFVVVRGSNGCGISTAGAAYCWGINGNIVSGGTDDCDGVPCAVTPVPVAGGLSFRDGTITIGAGHLCAVATGGSTYCWGINYSGQLGDGTNTHASSPVPVAGGFAFLMLAAADLHTCGVTDQHSAYCWGNNTNGWLGTGTDASTNTPQLVAGGFEFSSVSTGDGHTCAVTLQGGVLCWGLNGAAQLGHGAPTPPQLSPVWLRFQ
jgi:alpha-tubulin suppressor-like RCC1 family protein